MFNIEGGPGPTSVSLLPTYTCALSAFPICPMSNKRERKDVEVKIGSSPSVCPSVYQVRTTSPLHYMLTRYALMCDNSANGAGRYSTSASPCDAAHFHPPFPHSLISRDDGRKGEKERKKETIDYNCKATYFLLLLLRVVWLIDRHCPQVAVH